MNSTWLNWAQKLNYFDPSIILSELRIIESEVATSNTPHKIKSLRTNKLKAIRESRSAALFCQGMSERIQTKVYFAPIEEQDFDFVTSWTIDNIRHFSPVQLKEVVSPQLNPLTSLNSIIESLVKYADSSNLNVAIHLNQSLNFNPELLKLTHLKLASVWIFASVTKDQSIWNLWGNFIETNPSMIQFKYP